MSTSSLREPTVGEGTLRGGVGGEGAARREVDSPQMLSWPPPSGLIVINYYAGELVTTRTLGDLARCRCQVVGLHYTNCNNVRPTCFHAARIVQFSPPKTNSTGIQSLSATRNQKLKRWKIKKKLLEVRVRHIYQRPFLGCLFIICLGHSI